MRGARLTVGEGSASKGAKRYREDTGKKISEKSQAKHAEGVYAGWSAGRVIMRVGGAMAVTARDRNGAKQAATARRWMQKKQTVRAAKKQTVGTASRGQAPRRRSAAAAREPARPARMGERRRYRYSDPRQANPPPPGPGRRRIGVYRPRLRQEGACPDPRRRIGLAWIAVFRWRPSTAGRALRPSGPGNCP